MNRFILTSLILSSVLVGVEQVQAATLPIDDFLNPPVGTLFFQPDDPPNGFPEPGFPNGRPEGFTDCPILAQVSLNPNYWDCRSQQTGLANVLGGSREMILSHTVNNPPSADFILTTMQIAGTGILSLDHTGSPGSGVGVVNWNVNTNFAPTYDRFALSVMEISPLPGASIPITIEAVTAGGTAQFNTTITPSTDISQPVLFPFSGFSNSALLNQTIQTLRLTTTVDGEEMITYKEFFAQGPGTPPPTNIPEPSLVLACLSLFGLAALWIQPQS